MTSSGDGSEGHRIEVFAKIRRSLACGNIDIGSMEDRADERYVKHDPGISSIPENSNNCGLREHHNDY